MADIALEGPHWRFALRLYRQPGAAEACLLLQDRLGVDVNVLLLAVHAAAERGVALDAGAVRGMDDAVASWRGEVVAALRTIRRRLKSGPEPAPSEITEQLRDQIKAAELQAEQIEQAVLAGWIERHGAGRQPSRVDIGHVLQTVVTHFAEAHYASAETAGSADVRAAVHSLLKAASSLDRASAPPQPPTD